MTSTMRLQLLLRAEKLPPVPSNTWQFQKKKSPNAFCTVSNLTEIGNILGIKRHLLATTEIVPQCASPEWATVVFLEHTPGTEHRIAVDIFHSHSGEKCTPRTANTQEHRGTLAFDDGIQLCGLLMDVETILSHRDQTLVERIPGSGRLIVRLEECCSSPSPKGGGANEEFKFHLRGLDIHNTRRIVLERPSLYFEIRRKQRGRVQDTWSLVYRSKCAQPSLNPYWDCDVVPLSSFVNGDVNREIRISVWDYSPDRTLVGWCATTVASLVDAQATQGNADRTKALELARGDHGQHISQRVGKLVVLHASVDGKHTPQMLIPDATAVQIMTPPQTLIPVAIAVEIPTPPVRRHCTFDEYVAGGHCALELCVAVDFSRSNGDFHLEGTPHYRSEENLNDYEWCMAVAAESVSKHNSSHEYPMWGFGAMFENVAYHIFQCGPTARSIGTRGLLNSYKVALQTGLEFGHESKYDNVIQAAAHYSKKQLDVAQQENKLSYTMLLILTTATEREILASRERIEAAHSAPLSIIFLRIDNGICRPPLSDLKMPESLCTLLEANSFTKTRDSRSLAETTLKHVRPQLAEYFSSRGIYP